MIKGISTVIGVILILMIAIALGGTAYLYISGTFTSKIATTFSIIDSINDTVMIRNDGTVAIVKIKATLDGNSANTIFDLNANLVGYWKMNEGTGTITKDSSGKGNDGNLQNGVWNTWVDGKFGKALQFDGINDYVQLPRSTINFGTTDFTISAWIKRDRSGAVDVIIASQPDSGWPSKAKQFSFYSNNPNQITLAESGVGQVNTNTVITDTNWHHVAVTFVDNSNTVRLYIDGVLDKTGTLALTSDNFAHYLRMGRGGTDFFNGVIDEVNIYNKALTTNEIEALYLSNGEIILEPGQTVTIKPIATPLTKGIYTLKLCSASMCNTAILTIV